MKKIFTVIVLSVVALTSCTNNEYVDALFKEMSSDIIKIAMEYDKQSAIYQCCPGASYYELQYNLISLNKSEQKVKELESDIREIELELLKEKVSQAKINEKKSFSEDVINLKGHYDKMQKYFMEWTKK